MRFCERPYRFAYLEGYGRQGTVVMCPYMSYGIAREIGNILEEDLYDIWHSPKAQTLRKTIEDQTFTYCEKMSCPWLENNSLPEVDEEEFKKLAIPLDLPDQINLAHDLTCNHKCPSCRNEIFCGDAKYVKNIQKINNRILPYINKASHVNACGLGDMFSSPYMMDLMERVNPENPKASFSFETNGVLFDEEHWRRLSNLHPFFVELSVTPNSFERHTYKYLSGGLDHLDLVFKNLHFMKAARKKGELDFLNITIVVQEKNYRELPKFVDRALNEFDADQVTIRSIYKWNKLSAEDYWFKDVMNPLHPYHQDMLEVLEDPILKNPRVYNWSAFNIHPANLHPAYRYKDYMDLAVQMFREESLGIPLDQRLKMQGIEKVIVYGVNQMAEVIIDALRCKNYPIRFCLARDTDTDYFKGIQVMRLQDYEPEPEDAVLLSNFHDKVFVERDLGVKGFRGKLISISELYK